jgi:hypothetical protein
VRVVNALLYRWARWCRKAQRVSTAMRYGSSMDSPPSGPIQNDSIG